MQTVGEHAKEPAATNVRYINRQPSGEKPGFAIETESESDAIAPLKFFSRVRVTRG